MKKKRSSFAGKVRANVQHQKESRSSYGYLKLPKGVSIFSPKPGSRVRLDFMPYIVSDPRHPDRNEDLGIAVEGSEWYRRPFRAHRNIGTENQSIVCLQSVGRKCPICEFRAQRQKEGAEKEEVDALKSSQRNIYCVIPKDDKDNEEKPHIWDVSQFLFQELLNQELEEDERYELFPDLEEGYTLRVRFDERSFAGTKFAEASRIDFMDRKKPYTKADVAGIPDLDQVLNILTAKEIEKIFLELADEDMADEDVPAPRRAAPKRDEEEDDEPPARKRSRDDDDDDDNDEPPPRRRSRNEEEDEKPSRKREEEEEEEEDDDPPPRRRATEERDEEEEEEEKPQRRRPAPVEEEEEEDDDDGEEDDEDDDDDDDGGDEGEDEEEEAEQVPPPKRSDNKRQAKTSDNECPSGHVFGKDTDEYDECDDCPLWNKCLDAKDSRARAH